VTLTAFFAAQASRPDNASAMPHNGGKTGAQPPGGARGARFGATMARTACTKLSLNRTSWHTPRPLVDQGIVALPVKREVQDKRPSQILRAATCLTFTGLTPAFLKFRDQKTPKAGYFA
jgi:hypothetical protein